MPETLFETWLRISTDTLTETEGWYKERQPTVLRNMVYALRQRVFNGMNRVADLMAENKALMERLRICEAQRDCYYEVWKVEVGDG